MKKIILMVAAATMFISCGTTKQVGSSTQNWQQQTVVNHTTNKSQAPQEVATSVTAQQAFEAQAPISVEMLDWGFGRSGDKAKAMRDALRSAQNNIAIRLYRAISSVDTTFGDDIEKGDKMATMNKRSEMIVGVVDNKTATISYTKAPVFSRDTNGIYECEIEVKLTPALLENICTEVRNTLSDNDEMKVRFEEEKYFEEVYKAALEEFRTANKKK